MQVCLRTRWKGGVSLLALAALIAGCQTPEPTATPTSERYYSQAEKLSRDHQYAAAAQAFEQSAAQQQGELRNRVLLLAAREWLHAGDTARAQAILTEIGNQLPKADLVSRYIIAADLALQTQQPARALDELDHITPPPPRERAPEILELRTKALFAYGRPLGAIMTATDREQLLNNPSDIEQNRRMIWDGVEQNAAKGINMTPPPGTNRVTAGWLELGKTALALGRNPFAAQTPISEWRAKYPEHPANELLNRYVLPQLSAAQQMPAEIALLLPLSGKQQAVSSAIRDGFLTASLQQASNQRPRIRIYDTSAGVVNAYRQATTDGVQFVVGPLLKEDITQLRTAFANNSLTPTATLALNTLGNGDVNTPTGTASLYQFALDPTDEAEQAAQQVMADGKKHGVVLVPDNEWGQRVHKAFTTRMNEIGGSVVVAGTYSTSSKDYAAPVRSVLLVDESRARANALNSVLGTKLEFEFRVRSDVEFIFVGAEPAAGRLIRPILRYHLLDETPIYATSNIYEPDSSAKANAELNGVMFPDMPWIVAPDDAAAALRSTLTRYWSARMRGGNNRLFAFGFDAYRLIPALQARSANLNVNAIPGMTGLLSIDTDGHVHRQLQWARVSEGLVQPITTTQTQANSLQ